MLKHRLRRVAVQELAEEIGGVAEVEDVLAELESESHRGAAPAKPQSSRPFVPTPTPVACPVAAVAKPPPPMPVASLGAAAAKPVLPRKRERVPVDMDMDCVACWNLSRGEQRARSEGTEWASERRCCSAVKKVSARTLHHLYFLCSSCTAVRAHYTLSDRLISSGHGGTGRGRETAQGSGRGKGRGRGRGRPGHLFLFLFLFFSFSLFSLFLI